jgi:hypothetical protein
MYQGGGCRTSTPHFHKRQGSITMSGPILRLGLMAILLLLSAGFPPGSTAVVRPVSPSEHAQDNLRRLLVAKDCQVSVASLEACVRNPVELPLACGNDSPLPT